jgi:hypothetical protein
MVSNSKRLEPWPRSYDQSLVDRWWDEEADEHEEATVSMGGTNETHIVVIYRTDSRKIKVYLRQVSASMATS